MESQLKGLIESIQRDGVQEAERRSRKIIAGAEARAEEIISEARKTAEVSLREAEQTTARWHQSAERQVQQAGENLIITIRERIIALFDNLLANEMKSSISTTQVGEIICRVVSDQLLATHRSQTAELAGNEEELAQIRTYLQRKLQKELTGSLSFITLKNGQKGLSLSFDGEHSGYRLSPDDICRAVQELLAPQLRSLIDVAAGDGNDTRERGAAQEVRGADKQARGA